jgi:signal transduction histidine kinase
VVEDFERAKRDLLDRLERDPEMHKALAEQLRKDFDESLTRTHDFLQLVKLVRGHAESLLRDKFPDLPNEEAAERLPTEGAIYFSTELMLAKMDSMLFIHEVNQALGNERRFQVHPLVLQYVRIYRWQAGQKNVSVRLEGEAYGYSRYNGKAVGTVVHALLDNLVKYAPPGSKAMIVFTESSDCIDVEFTSLGPRIEETERQKIFILGYRAQAARGIESTGLGVGLATAKNISDALGLELRVTQAAEPDSKYASRYETTFTLRLAKD